MSTMQGLSAVIRWGYLEAAVLGSWSMSIAADGGHLSATVIRSDAFRASQQPLTFVTPRGAVFPVESLQIAGESVSARLGLPRE